MDRVKGKVAIVTGAGSGIGKADAIRLAEEGASVVLTDIDLKALQAVADQIGGNAIAMGHDVADEAQWQEVIAKTLEVFGGLHILVNNAGILKLGSVVDTSLKDWRLVQSINCDGIFLGCKHGIPAMTASGGGSIINMSSVASRQGMGFSAAYCASKGAVAALTRDVAIYCKQQKNNIRCNSIHPDGVKTPMVSEIAIGKKEPTKEEMDALGANMAEPEEIAALVLYLATDESRFVNGAEMLIDNAATITPPVGL